MNKPRPLLPEDRVVEARRRHGKPFATSKDSTFRWQAGPVVLPKWLQERKANGR